MSKFDFFQQELSKLREQVPRLVDLLQIGSDEIGKHWKNLDTKLLPLIDRHLPLMVAVCGGANAGKSMFFNSFLGINLSPVRGDAGSRYSAAKTWSPACLNPSAAGRKRSPIRPS